MVPVGEPVMDVSGELVCTKSFPSMPSHFWNDPDGAKYKRAYFSKYPGSYVQNAKILYVATCVLPYRDMAPWRLLYDQLSYWWNFHVREKVTVYVHVYKTTAYKSS